MGNTKSAAGCQTHEPRPARPTVHQAARHLLEALDRLLAGTEARSFHGWENGYGELAGDELEEARRTLEVLLAGTPYDARLLTNADFDVDAFNRAWHSERVQTAGKKFGWRGVAEAMWAVAFQLAAAPAAECDTGFAIDSPEEKGNSCVRYKP